jgi:hypothetical protein
MQPNNTVRVRTLLCHRDVPLMIDCWRTLIACSVDPVETVIHEDGSLTREDEAAIQAAIPHSRVLWRRDADAIMAERLARHENARAFRAGSVWGLKLLDVVLAEAGDCFYVDGDVRFFRRFRGLFCREAVENRSVFLRDTVWTAYSIRPWHLLDGRRLRVSAAINTGLTLIDRARFDLDFVDWFLAQPDWRVIPAWTEPTCWAALAARGHGHAIDPAQVTNLYPSAHVNGGTVGAHFLSAYRNRFRDELSAPMRMADPIVEMRIQPLGKIGPVGLGLNQLKRKLSNEWARRRKS